MLCRSLNNVIFVNGVRRIDNYAFDSAGPLGNLYFGEHLISIGQQAFGFSGLKTFVADAESVEYSAFAECQSLTSLHFTDKGEDVLARTASSTARTRRGLLRRLGFDRVVQWADDERRAEADRACLRA